MVPKSGGPASDVLPSTKRLRDPLDGSPYLLLGLLGEGGMGEVFDAEHRALGHRVVVKVLHETLSDRDDMRDRMRVEGQALARIRHPHLVMVTDFGETWSHRPYIVMERLVGRSLREELGTRFILPPAEAAEIARQMLHGLSAAHQAGLVHRDIKPDNVFLCATEDGRPFVKVLDFGVVKIAQGARDPRTPAPLAFPTAEGVTLGTPRYFSPEQTRAEPDLDARSDVYAVGLVLYVMLVGRGPFDHVTELRDIFAAHATKPPAPPATRAPQLVPAELNDIVMRALRKGRDERFQDALSFANALGRFLSGLGDEGRRYASAVPLLVSSPDGRALAEASTANALAVEAGPVSAGPANPTKTATPAVQGAGSDLRSTSRKLSDAPVVLEGVVERVLSNPPEHVREKLSRSGNIDRTVIDAVPAGAASARAPAPATAPAPASAPVVPASAPVPAPAPVSASCPAVPETVPMFELAPPPRPAHASAPVPVSAPPAGSPSALPGHTIPLPTLRRPTARAPWKVPALVAAAVLLVAAALLAARSFG